ncbi:MAG: hypothetical protein QOC92_66 [Acidimicrobiaceae bacterium]
MTETYEEFRRRLLERHQKNATSALSTAGDVVMVGGLALGLVTRQARVAIAGVALGLGVAAFAHVFQPGTLGDEVGAILRHPLWAVRAETGRIAGRVA